MAKIFASDPGAGLARFAASLGNLGQTIYDVDAENEAREANLSIATDIEKFKESLWQDPDYGTPGQNDGYAKKWNDFLEGTKQNPGLKSRILGSMTNEKAKEKVSYFIDQTAIQQQSEVEELQFKRWAEGTVAKAVKRANEILDKGGIPVQTKLDAAHSEYDYLRGHNLITQEQYQNYMDAASQVAIRRDLTERAKTAYLADGLAAALRVIAEDQTSYSAGGGTFFAGDQVKNISQQDMKLWDATYRQSSLDDALASYKDASQIESFLPDEYIKNETQSYPKWLQSDIEDELRKKQGSDNYESALAQYNQDRSNPSLSYLEKQYKAVQKSPLYIGDEKTRNTVMSWYEGLIGTIRAGSAGMDKEKNEDALSLSYREIELLKSGKGGVSGYSTIHNINERENNGDLSAAQANQLRNTITEHLFPQAKPFLEKVPETVRSLLGFKDKKNLSSEQINQQATLESIMNSKIIDKLMEEGGNITPQRMNEIFEQARYTATAKELDSVHVGFALFKDKSTITEESYAKTKSALDSPAGREAVFTDINGNTQFLSKNPAAFRDTVETVARYEEEQLAARGINIASSAFESEDKQGYDISGSKIYTGTDGKKYRFFAEGGKMVPYVNANGKWAKLGPAPVTPKASAPKGTPLAEYPKPDKYKGTTEEWDALSLAQKEYYYAEYGLKKKTAKKSAQERIAEMGNTYIPPND